MAVLVWILSLALWSIALAEPIKAPLLSNCRNITLKGSLASFRCCPPEPRVVREWRFQEHLPMRVRRPSHTLVNDTGFWEKYTRAVSLLRALPEDDPRSWQSQAWLHCAYCNSALVQTGVSPDTPLHIHKGWLFLAWHRWFVYFHERILARLIGDDTFALPFWNFDNQTAAPGHHPANIFPPEYTRWEALKDVGRSRFHHPPQIVDLAFSWPEDQGASPYSDEELVERNMMGMHRGVYGATTPELFFGHRYVQGTPGEPGGGTLEYVPHNKLHDWIGDISLVDHETMGNFYSAARDPIFFAVHANMDRFWTVWKKWGGRREDITEEDWLRAEFLFFDENGDGVKVNVADALDTEKLRYRYEDVQNAWVNYRPRAHGSGILKTIKQHKPPSQGGIISWSSKLASRLSHLWEGNLPSSLLFFQNAFDAERTEHLADFPLLRPASTPGQTLVSIVGLPFHCRVRRPRKLPLRRLAEAVGLQPVAEQVLSIEGLTTPMFNTNSFDVFINLPEADAKTPITIAEYAGTFHEIPRTAAVQDPNGQAKFKYWRTQNFRLPLNEVLQEVGASESSDYLVVSIVPRTAGKFEIEGISVELV